METLDGVSDAVFLYRLKQAIERMITVRKRIIAGTTVLSLSELSYSL